MARLEADAASMEGLYGKHFKSFEYINGNSLFHGTDAKGAQKALDTIEEAEKALSAFAKS